MLNERGQRELAYVVVIDRIEHIEGSDNCEAAYVGGWHIMVRKGTFQAGDLAIYFEIDSHLDTTKPEFTFLEKKHGNIKTQRYTFGGKGNFLSQGLLMHPSDFGWTTGKILKHTGDTELSPYIDDTKELYFVDDESRFLTNRLEVKHIADTIEPKEYRRGVREPKSKFGKWLMKRKWGRMLFRIFRKKRKRNGWPTFIKKTDEERCQNLPEWYYANKEWIATEKIDGSSTTFAYYKKKFYVCSRNVVMDNPNRKCYYGTNVYHEMAQKYDAENKLQQMLKDKRRKDMSIVGIIVQGETYGNKIQKNNYGLKSHDFAVFNIIWIYRNGTQVRLNPIDGEKLASEYGLPYVPVLGKMTLPTTCDAVLEIAGSDVSKINGEMREGIVFRYADGVKSFKAVNNEYLLKYHS